MICLCKYRSDREDVNHLFALQILKLFAPDVELVEQIRNFRFLDGRNFNGFIYGGKMPHGRQKRATALINKPGSFGGSRQLYSCATL